MSKPFIITFSITAVILLVAIHFWGNQIDAFFLRPIPGTPYDRISNRGLGVVILSGVIIYLVFWLLIRKENRK